MERENFYKELKLTSNPAETDDTKIRNAINKFEKHWERLKNSQTLQATAKLSLLPLMNEIMLDPQKRLVEANDREIEIKGEFCNSYEKEKADIREQFGKFFSVLKLSENDLYTFLNTPYTSSEEVQSYSDFSSAEEVKERADFLINQYKKITAKATERDFVEKLSVFFGSSERKEKYDEFLRNESRYEKAKTETRIEGTLKEIAKASPSKRSIPQDILHGLIEENKGTYYTLDELKRYVNDFIKSHGFTIETVVFGAENTEMIQLLISSLEKTQQNLRMVQAIGKLQKNPPEFSDLYPKVAYERKVQELFPKEEKPREIYEKMPAHWKAISNLKLALPILLMFSIVFIGLAYQDQLADNISLIIGCAFILLIFNNIYSARYRSWQKSVKFMDCLGFVLAKWTFVALMVVAFWWLETYDIIYFDIFYISNDVFFSFAMFCMLLRVVLVPLYNCSQGQYIKLYADDKKVIVDRYFQESARAFIDESLLKEIPKKYWTTADIQKMIGIATDNKLTSLSDVMMHLDVNVNITE